MDEPLPVEILPSAFRHGVHPLRILHVLNHWVVGREGGRGVLLLFGPDDRGIDLEVGIVMRDGVVCVVHAMKLRRSFRAEYRRHLPWRR